MIIDAHQHFWRRADAEQPWRTSDHHPIDRDYQPADLVAATAATPVRGTVLVESVDGQEENDRLAGHAEHPVVAGVVGWLPLRDPDAAATELDRLTIPRLAGVRCLVGRDPLEWTADQRVRRTFATLAERGLAWDVVVVTSEQAAAVIELARAVPELRIVIDHLARPPVESGAWQPWADRIARLAECPGAAIKLSVGLDALSAWPSWQPDALQRYVEWAVLRFGPDRCMLASNWPVVELRADYRTAWQDLDTAAAEAAGSAGRAELRGGTARRWYGLDRFAPIGTEPTKEIR